MTIAQQNAALHRAVETLRSLRLAAIVDYRDATACGDPYRLAASHLRRAGAIADAIQLANACIQ